MRTRNPLFILVALVAALTLFAACGRGGGSDNKSAPGATPPEQDSPSGPSLDLPTATEPELDLPTTTTTAPECDRCDRSEELKALPDEECTGIDAYAYLGFNPAEDPKSLPNGAQFYYDCVTDYWGWYFEGNSGDTYEEPVLDRRALTIPEDCEYGCPATLPLEYSGVPATRQHPAYPDALTLDELKPGLVVCIRGDLNSITRTVKEVFTRVSIDAAGEPSFFYAAYSTVEDDTGEDEYYIPNSVVEDGLAPNSFGKWDTIHVTAGAC